MNRDIDKASLQDIISLISEGITEQEIAEMKGYKSPNTVSNRLKAVGAEQSSGKWDFAKIDSSMLTKPFWPISYSKDQSRTSIELLPFSENEVNALKVIAEEYMRKSNERETETLKYEMYGKLLFEHASYRNKELTTKQLNVPVPETVMQRLDDFINTSGLEKKFIVNKALEVFLDLYDGDLQIEI
jgi:hypothetical protein